MIDGVSGGNRDLELGDVVDFNGMKGEVIKVEHNVWHDWPITVKFNCGREVLFKLDGRMYDEQTVPCLEVIGKMKPRTKRWQFLCKSILTGNYYATNHMSDEEVSLQYGQAEIKKILESETEYDD